MNNNYNKTLSCVLLAAFLVWIIWFCGLLVAQAQAQANYGDLERRIVKLETAELEVQFAVMRSQLDTLLSFAQWLLLVGGINVLQFLWHMAPVIQQLTSASKRRNGHGNGE